ncbi:MAG TPA: response regulator [Chitinophagaceae bacterium]|nr:response regulator [Chitinophagaceae bacterium]
MTGNILIVDDEEQLRKLLTRIISLEGFKVAEAGTLKAATEVLKQQPIDVVLCDVRLPDGNGVEFVKTVKNNFPSLEIILLTAYGNIADGVQSIKNGAFDYIVKGDDNNRIIPLLYQAVDKTIFQKKSAIKISDKTLLDFGSIIGESAAIKNAIKLAQKISDY